MATPAKKKIGVLTSGGDSPGMNGVVRAVVRTAIHMGCDAYFIKEGYKGLVVGGDLIKKADWQDVRGFLSRGGTLIGTDRCDEFRQREGRLIAAKNMVTNGIDGLVICGGDGSLTGANKFRSEWPSLVEELVTKGDFTAEQAAPFRHLNIVGVVGTIDNDFAGTDATIGAYTALDTICELVDKVDDTASSHKRGFVIKVMGRHCGWLALMAGVALGADYIFIPERPRGDNWRDEISTNIRKHREGGKRETIVIVAEGAKDQHGAPITSEMVLGVLADKKGLALDARITDLGHIQRGGKPNAYDRVMGTLQGVECVKALLEATPETETSFVGVNENKVVRKPLMAAVEETQKVSSLIDAQEFDKAMALRDTEFSDQYQSFVMTTAIGLNKDLHLPNEKRMKIGFINVGAGAAGMNPAVRAGVAYCKARGHHPIAIHGGFGGLARHHDDADNPAVRDFDWAEVDGWASLGGSMLGTTRELPEKSGLGRLSEVITHYGFDALFVVGGFEAFHAVSQLRKARDEFPALRLPYVVLPATISNNVPGTEYSLGSDTGLNALVTFCDPIKQSASATGQRLSVVKTQGGLSGYLPTLTGLAMGASAVYIPEEGIDLQMIKSDSDHYGRAFENDKGLSQTGRLLLVGGKADKTYSARVIADILQREAHGRYETRYSEPENFQQGDRPSAMDRCRAVRLAVKCIQQLEQYGPRTAESGDAVLKDPLSVSVIGVKGARVVFSAMEQVERDETDWANRRPKTAHWVEWKDTVDVMARRAPYKAPRDSVLPQLRGFNAKI